MACRPQTKKLTVASNCIHLSEAPKKVGNKKLKINMHNWLVVSTHLKNISQIGSLPQVGVKIKNI